MASSERAPRRQLKRESAEALSKRSASKTTKAKAKAPNGFVVHGQLAPLLIYGLICPLSRLIRYIGISTSGVRRPKRHSYALRKDTYCRNWVKTLQAQGLNYEIVILETFENASALSAAERWWIAFGKALGWPLTNLAEGGFDGLRRPCLTEDKILAWADAHQKRTGTWPTANSGVVVETSGTTDETSWSGICSALWDGSRGLPSKSSLAKLLAANRGVRNCADLPTLTEKLIIEWALAHKKRAGEYPNVKSGRVVDITEEESWQAVNLALGRGTRGLPGGTSLAALLEKELCIRNKARPPQLAETQIIEWARVHWQRAGKWPGVKSGAVVEEPNENWGALNMALCAGLRGLPGGSSLAKLFELKLNKRNHCNLPSLTEAQIVEWAKAHKCRTGEWPGKNSGAVVEAPEMKWNNIDVCLGIGQRGLPGSSSLAKLLTVALGIGKRVNGSSRRIEDRKP